MTEIVKPWAYAGVSLLQARTRRSQFPRKSGHNPIRMGKIKSNVLCGLKRAFYKIEFDFHGGVKMGLKTLVSCLHSLLSLMMK
ncbi:MAG: hypothetical protein D6704_00555 [Nitrospirae bacterium]|nr:MAG: hypothetical protein D6704_00555 [Nitrospirota bacterium]